MSDIINSRVLKVLGLNHKNTWIVYDKAPKQLFEYLSVNFDDKQNVNILSDEEFAKFKEIQESCGEWLNNQKVNESMKWVKENYPETDDLSDEKIRELENDLDFHTNLLIERDRRCEKLQKAINSMQQENESNEREELDLNSLERRLRESCSSSINELDQLVRENHAKVTTINSLYSQKQKLPILMSLLIDDRDMNKLKIIENLTQLFITECIKNGENLESDRINSSIVEIYRKICELNAKFFHDEVSLEGFRNIQNIETFEFREIRNCLDIQDLIANLQEETEKLEEFHNIIMNDVIATCDNHQEMKISSLFDTFFGARNMKTFSTLNNIKKSNEILESTIQLFELIWFSLNSDMKRLNDRIDNSHELSTEAEAVNSRINLMKNANNVDHTEIVENLICGKLNEISESFNKNNLITNLQEIVKVQDEIEDSRQICVNRKHLSAIYERLEFFESQRKQLAEFVYNGATNCPKLIDSKFITQISTEQRRLQNFEKAFVALRTQIKENILKPWESDEIFRLQRNLWIYFMIEPHKFFDSLEKIKKKSSEKGIVKLKMNKKP